MTNLEAPQHPIRITSFRDDPVVLQLLQELDDLERRTSPLQADSQDNKDAAANEALSLASRLAAHVSGWAVRHKIGLALHGHRNIPDIIPTARTPEYNALRAEFDNHRHEAQGSSLDAAMTDKAQRAALSNLMSCKIGGVPEMLARSISDALDALDFGNTVSLLEAEKDYRKHTLGETKLQLFALCYVEFNHARGGRKLALLKDVANEFGVSEDTARGWERRLREWDTHQVTNAFSRAQHLGKMYHQTNDPRYDRVFGLLPLKRWAAEYKTLLRDRC